LAARLERRAFLLAAVSTLAACAASQPASPVGVDRANLATVFVYRPRGWYHAFNPEAPFVYVGDRQIGTVRVGGQIGVELPAGSHRLVIKKPILFMPAYEVAGIDLNLEPGKRYYVRYSLEPAGVIVTPVGVAVPGSSGLALVDEETAQRER
jgi:hypothetical protein